MAYKYDSDALVADNTKFTISNLDASDKLVALYTNIKADRKLDKDDVFGYYKLSSIGKASNQEIEIFQLFKDRPVETATVGWVGVGNMSYNVFVPYYPMLIDSMYKGYQVSTASAKFTTEKPDTFCTYGTRRRMPRATGSAFPASRRIRATGRIPITSRLRVSAVTSPTPTRSPASP